MRPGIVLRKEIIPGLRGNDNYPVALLSPFPPKGGFAYNGDGNATTYHATAVTFDIESRLTAHRGELTACWRGGGLRAWKERAHSHSHPHPVYLPGAYYDAQAQNCDN